MAGTGTTKTLPPVETTPVLLMEFSKTCSPGFLHAVAERLIEGGLRILLRENDGRLLGLSAAPAELEAEAEHIRLVKRRADTNIMEKFTVQDREFYLNSESRSWKDAQGLFTPNDVSLLVWRLMDDISVLPEGQLSSNLSRLLDNMRIPYRLPGTTVNTLKLRLMLRKHELSTENTDQTAKLRHVLRKHHLCSVITPIHQVHIRNEIFRKTMYSWDAPVEDIRDYYGEQISFYFAWMSFLTKFLICPAIFGLFIFVLRWYRQDTIDEDSYTPFYGLLCFVWSIIYIRFWQRHENRLAYSWGTFSQSSYEQQHYFLQRPQFHGKLRRSPVTGAMETYYPASRRRLKYVLSALITCCMLGVAFSVMIFSLNLQGYINPKTDPERWNEHNPHPFHYPMLSLLAEEGHAFDAKHSWRCFLPSILHVACIFSMNFMYRYIAEHLTAFENHETQVAHQNSLILKRFLFEAFDAYVALFYLAFFERDVDRLRLELITIFNIDTFRRLLLECILPMVYRQVFGMSQKNHKKKNDDDNTAAPYKPLSEEASRDPYEQFDDYMEIVIQLGYVTLFASAYPLASLIAIAANLIEIRADCFKLTHVCQKPRSLRTDGCGMWNTLVECILWMSALTNCLLFGFTSSQLMQYMPDFYYVDTLGHMRLMPGKGWIVVFIIFGVERLLIVVALLIYAVVPKVPEDVMEELERRHFVREQESAQVKLRNMSGLDANRPESMRSQMVRLLVQPDQGR